MPAETKPEVIWRGRLHLGDEPGVYGNATYVGLAVVLPVTLRKLPEPIATGQSTVLCVETEDVRVHEPYPGHKVRTMYYIPAPIEGAPHAWAEAMPPDAPTYRLTTSGQVEVPLGLPAKLDIIHASVCIQVDTAVQAGAYDDFVVTGLFLRSGTHYASFGFEIAQYPLLGA